MSKTVSRKDDHIKINLEEDVRSSSRTGFESLCFVHQALPELNYANIDTCTQFLGHTLNAPLLISCMTGGTERAAQINKNLAIAAEKEGLAMGLGSMRALLERPETLSSFNVKKYAPNLPFLLANLGLVQLNYGVKVEDCQRLVDRVEADALVFHLNILQELLQPEGNTNWKGLLHKLEKVAEKLTVPVICKEVGYGISTKAARLLINAGVHAIDIAGAGGTSWSQVEAHRTKSAAQRHLAESFRHWGIPTRRTLEMVRAAYPHFPIIASGGIDSGQDAALALRLGAHLVGQAAPFLKAATHNTEAVIQEIQLLKRQLQVIMACTGSGTLSALTDAEILDTRDT